MKKFWYWTLKIALWLVCIVLAIMTFPVVVGPAGVLLMGAVFLLAPIEDWQDLLNRKIGKWVKIALLVAALVGGILTYDYSVKQTNNMNNNALTLEEAIQNAELEAEAKKAAE